MDPIEPLARAPFALGDVVRRAQGGVLDAFGLGPSERRHVEVCSGPHWRLRDYGGPDGSPAVLIVAAPIKRPYIWDLSRSTSAVGYCLDQGLHVYLLEWLPASLRDARNGLDEYTGAVSRCVAEISRRSGGAKPFLAGHSLGGTLAAIFAATAGQRIQGLVLLAAPLCFAPGTSRFRDSLTALVPPGLSPEHPFPGSLLTQWSALASPETFIWSRLMDAAASSTDLDALRTHAGVERWALDELPLPGRLVAQVLEWLYREDRLCRGVLEVCGTTVGPARVAVPTLAVVNVSDGVVPATAVRPFLKSMAARDVQLIEHPGELGVALQHLAVLIGRQAHARSWPEIVAWMKARAGT